MAEKNETKNQPDSTQEISEGQANIVTGGRVFYNPVQEFNRDLSISVLNAFSKQYEGGISILEALSATGLRSIRYAKEVVGVKQITANDLSGKAVEDIRGNIMRNGVENLVKANHEDAMMLMYRNKRTYDAVDLDPYGCPSNFLDSAVQTVKDGGLLLVTATDMAVLCGNSPQTCYSKYGAISLRMKCCHEMALRILLQCIEAHANRHGRYIDPLVSVSADFYVRVFVRVYTSPQKCKATLSKLSNVLHCTGCGSYVLQPLGGVKQMKDNPQQLKYTLPTWNVLTSCEHCKFPYHLGGPIWAGPLHNLDFVMQVLETAPEHLTTYKRIQGVLTMITEELPDVPLYYTLEQLSGTLHVDTPKMSALRSAILNAGFRVSYTHTNKTSIKTDAPAKVLWDIMRCWQVQHPVSEKRLSGNSPASNILAIKSEAEHSFLHHPNEQPESRRLGFLRFQQNPAPNWGPGCRATAMIGEDKLDKRKNNQGKRKRDDDASSMAKR